MTAVVGIYSRRKLCTTSCLLTLHVCLTSQKPTTPYFMLFWQFSSARCCLHSGLLAQKELLHLLYMYACRLDSCSETIQIALSLVFGVDGATTALPHSAAIWSSCNFSVWRFVCPSTTVTCSSCHRSLHTGTCTSDHRFSVPGSRPQISSACGAEISYGTGDLPGARCGVCGREASTQHLREPKKQLSIAGRQRQGA